MLARKDFYLVKKKEKAFVIDSSLSLLHTEVYFFANIYFFCLPEMSSNFFIMGNAHFFRCYLGTAFILYSCAKLSLSLLLDAERLLPRFCREIHFYLRNSCATFFADKDRRSWTFSFLSFSLVLSCVFFFLSRGCRVVEAIYTAVCFASTV